MANADIPSSGSHELSNLPIPGAWGQPITTERQTELQTLIERWSASEAATQGTQGPFAGIRLTGADVFWFAVYVGMGDDRTARNLHLEGADLSDAHLEGASLAQVHLEGANLYRAHLERADLSAAHLEGSLLSDAHLEGAKLTRAHLQGADLHRSHFEATDAAGANLDESSLAHAYLANARLDEASLFRADLTEANLEHASLVRARLEGANLTEAWLKDVDLRGALMDSSILVGTNFGRALLADVRWGSTNVSGIDWTRVRMLGDELVARQRKTSDGTLKSRATRIAQYAAAIRAYQGLLPLLKLRNLRGEADRFAYRALLLERKENQLSHDWLAWFGSSLLDLVAGYGYKPIRLVLTYLVLVGGYAAFYYVASISGISALAPLSPGDAYLFSFQVILGRSVPVTMLSLHDPVNTVADTQILVSLLYGYIFANVVTKRLFGGQG